MRGFVMIAAAFGLGLALTSPPAFAQHMDHAAHDCGCDHSTTASVPAEGHRHHEPATTEGPQTPFATRPGAMGNGGVDHGSMGHGAMDHGSMNPAVANPKVLSVGPAAFDGPAYTADLSYDPAAMAVARERMLREHGDMTVTKFAVERLEVQAREGREGYAWEGRFWTGKDLDKFLITTEGEGTFGTNLEGGEVQALWSHAINPFFDLHVGLRQDFGPGPSPTYATVGAEGVLPYWIEVRGSAFLSDQGDVLARIEAEYDARITNRLVLQPRIEANLAAQRISEQGIGSGLSDMEAGVRLRYFVTRQASAYVGVEYRSTFGGTRRDALEEGEDATTLSGLAGISFWF